MYVLDTNVFIQAKNLGYEFDICPGFWNWLEISNQQRIVFSIERVRDEIRAQEDRLTEWSKDRDDTFFLKPTREVLDALTDVGDWVRRQNYSDAAIDTFLRGADFFLTAHALARNLSVVTHETLRQATTKIKIPTVCYGLGITCLTPYEMLRREHVRFVLEKAA